MDYTASAAALYFLLHMVQFWVVVASTSFSLVELKWGLLWWMVQDQFSHT